MKELPLMQDPNCSCTIFYSVTIKTKQQTCVLESAQFPKGTFAKKKKDITVLMEDV